MTKENVYMYTYQMFDQTNQVYLSLIISNSKINMIIQYLLLLTNYFN